MSKLMKRANRYGRMDGQAYLNLNFKWASETTTPLLLLFFNNPAFITHAYFGSLYLSGFTGF